MAAVSAQRKPREPNVLVSWPPGYLERCAAALEIALGGVPAYHSWRDRDPGPGVAVLARYAALPLLTKDDLRRFGPEGLLPPGRSISDGLAAGEIELVHTSGTTSEQVVNVWCQAWWDACERASWRLNALARGLALGPHREAILTSPRQTGVAHEHGYLETEDRTLGRFLYLNERTDAGSWTAEHMDRMLRELDAFSPEVLEANPSFLAQLCRHALRTRARVRLPSLVVLSYENPSPVQRRLIARVFPVPVASSYGSTEAGYVFMECEAGRMHQLTACCHVDALPFDDRSGKLPGLVRLAATSFDNPWRSLVRFDLGDLGRLADRPCPCGNGDGLLLERIEGRLAGVTLAADGRPVTPAEVDQVVATVAGVVDFRLRQHAPGSCRVLYVTDSVDGGDGRRGEQLRRRLAALYGVGSSVEVEEVNALSPEQSGKYLRAAAEFPRSTDGG